MVTLKDSESNVASNLDTYTHTTSQASLYSMAIRCNEIPPSGLIVTIQHNGSNVASTTVAPASAQQVINLSALNIFCAQGDTISAIFSSAAASDALPNAFRAIISVGRGSTF